MTSRHGAPANTAGLASGLIIPSRRASRWFTVSTPRGPRPRGMMARAQAAPAARCRATAGEGAVFCSRCPSAWRGSAVRRGRSCYPVPRTDRLWTRTRCDVIAVRARLGDDVRGRVDVANRGMGPWAARSWRVWRFGRRGRRWRASARGCRAFAGFRDAPRSLSTRRAAGEVAESPADVVGVFRSRVPDGDVGFAARQAQYAHVGWLRSRRDRDGASPRGRETLQRTTRPKVVCMSLGTPCTVAPARAWSAVAKSVVLKISVSSAVAMSPRT